MSEEIILQMEARRLGEYLACSAGTLQNAVKQQGQALKNQQKVMRIGEILLENGTITRAELETAILRQRIDRLRASPVFAPLSNSELASLSSRFMEISVPTGQTFINQDQHDPSLYIIASGRVQVYVSAPDKSETHIAYVDAPEPIGEMGYFSGGIRTASVRAVRGTTELIKAEYSDITDYFEDVPHVAHIFMRIVDQRRRETEEIIQLQES